MAEIVQAEERQLRNSSGDANPSSVACDMASAALNSPPTQPNPNPLGAFNSATHLPRCCPDASQGWVLEGKGEWNGCGFRSVNLAAYEDIKLLVRQYAPEVRLHSAEQFFPAEVHWYLAKTSLKYREHHRIVKKNEARDIVILERVTDSKLLAEAVFEKHNSKTSNGITVKRAGIASYSDYRYLKSKEDKDPGFYLAIIDDEAKRGQPEETKENKTPVYVRVRRQRKSNAVDSSEPDVDWVNHYLDVQYFFFFGYNGAVVPALPKAGIHEGDWEHITLRFEKNNNAEWNLYGIWTDRHSFEGKWYFKQATNSDFSNGWRMSDEDGGCHPIIYCSLHGHTSYVTSGRQKRFVPLGMIDDRTDDAGLRWKTWNNIVLLGEIHDENYLKENNQWWLRYIGKWGRFGKGIEASGPVGPGVKTYYPPCSEGDTAPNAENSVK